MKPTESLMLPLVYFFHSKHVWLMCKRHHSISKCLLLSIFAYCWQKEAEFKQLQLNFSDWYVKYMQTNQNRGYRYLPILWRHLYIGQCLFRKAYMDNRKVNTALLSSSFKILWAETHTLNILFFKTNQLNFVMKAEEIMLYENGDIKEK